MRRCAKLLQHPLLLVAAVTFRDSNRCNRGHSVINECITGTAQNKATTEVVAPIKRRMKAVLERARLRETCSLATQTAQVEQLGARNLVGATFSTLSTTLEIREDALYALSAHLERQPGTLCRGITMASQCLHMLSLPWGFFINVSALPEGWSWELCLLELG